MGNDVMAQAEPTILQTGDRSAPTLANASTATRMRRYFGMIKHLEPI